LGSGCLNDTLNYLIPPKSTGATVHACQDVRALNDCDILHKSFVPKIPQCYTVAAEFAMFKLAGPALLSYAAACRTSPAHHIAGSEQPQRDTQHSNQGERLFGLASRIIC